MMYKSWFFLKNILFADLVYSQGEHGQHSRAEISAFTQGEHTPLPLMTKGENYFEDLRLPSSPNEEIVGIMV